MFIWRPILTGTIYYLSNHLATATAERYQFCASVHSSVYCHLGHLPEDLGGSKHHRHSKILQKINLAFVHIKITTIWIWTYQILHRRWGSIVKKSILARAWTLHQHKDVDGIHMGWMGEWSGIHTFACLALELTKAISIFSRGLWSCHLPSRVCVRGRQAFQ